MEANKSTLGLGKVINRLQVDGNDISILISRIEALESTKLISGSWDTLVSNNPGYVTESSGVYTFNLNNNLSVEILVNHDAKKIRLIGGLNGRSYYFKFNINGSYTVEWDNVRATNADAPALTMGTLGSPKTSTVTICKVGNEYYITDVNLNVI